MKAAAVMGDLLLFSRITAAAAAAGVSLVRVDSPHDLPPGLELALVDWSARRPDWAGPLRELGARVIVFGPHTDLAAHAAAREAGLAPMWARSKLVASLPILFQSPSAAQPRA